MSDEEGSWDAQWKVVQSKMKGSHRLLERRPPSFILDVLQLLTPLEVIPVVSGTAPSVT